ncbi:MAG TPA: LysM peptidoglycan-binding domain-containing protein [Pyrinomonadaceae bacterium]|nr:LysM peptidoglycan-binding domain-containing protein [Pyrinomonadaceae bacterium]
MGDAENTNAGADSSEPVESPQVTYTVQSGDTLAQIAREYYGSADEYRRIFEANRDKLDDPDEIRPGQELVIPPAES